MTISTSCPSCRNSLEFDDAHANMQGSCPACGTAFVIPAATPAPVGGYNPAPAGYTAQPNPYGGQTNPYASSQVRPDGPGYGYGPAGYPGYMLAHRGGMLLTFGILGIILGVACAILGLIFGILGWVMGAGDLKQMAAGRMDPSGSGNTRAGMICGIIGVVIAVLNIMFGIALVMQQN